MSNEKTDGIEKQETYILSGDCCVKMKRPVFTHGIKLSQYTKDIGNPPFRFEMHYGIEFECGGPGADAFMHEFLKLADKYNHLEVCYYHPEVLKKETWFEKIKNLVRRIFCGGEK